jgi:hypothetical protein
MKKALFALSVLTIAAFSTAFGQAHDTAKAEFVINLFDKVEWPSNSAQEQLIYVIGDSPIVPLLEEKASGKSKDGKIIKIKKISVDDDFTGCHILYIASDDLADLAKILKKVKGTSILTVSHVDGFARYGVMINVLDPTEKSKEKIGLVINKMTARDAGIKIDPKLIASADKTFG